VSSETNWLPVGLEPVALRLARVDDAAFQIGKLASAWSNSGNGPLSLSQRRLDDSTVELVVTQIRPIPPVIAMLFGEAVNHLRSAIENTLFHVVQAQRGTALPNAQANHIKMPIHDSALEFTRWLEGNAKKGIPELGPDSVLAARIQTVQPFSDSAVIPSVTEPLASIIGAEVDFAKPLLLLQKYSNDDKHRMIRMAAARTSTVRSDSFTSGDKRLHPIEVGQVLDSTRPGTRTEVSITTAVHLERPSGLAWVAPVRELDSLFRHVSQVVIPTIVTGLALEKGLPPQVDLEDSGLSERERIEAGAWETAHRRLATDMIPAFLEHMAADPTLVPHEQSDEPGEAFPTGQ
jgi:hypothetical protein